MIMEDKKHTHFIEVWSGYKNKPHNTECVEIEKLPIYLKITEEYMFCKTVAIWKIKLK
jgi:hypothetical protein